MQLTARINTNNDPPALTYICVMALGLYHMIIGVITVECNGDIVDSNQALVQADFSI